MKFVGGRLCLDFVNTVDAWADALEGPASRNYGDFPLREKLVDYAALVRWGQLAAVIHALDASHLIERSINHAPEAAATLARAHRLRRTLYRILKSLLESWEPEGVDTAIFYRELRIAREHERLVFHEGAFHWTWDESPNALDRMIWPVARSAADLLTSDDLSRLRQCLGSECGWIFLDTSRNRSRNWCDMSDCGNREKVRRFRNRSPRLLPR